MNDLERRSEPRFLTEIPVALYFPAGRIREGWGWIHNISAVGVMIESRFPVKVGGVVYLSFSLKDGHQFQNLRARIVRSQYEDGYYIAGVAFDDVVDQETLRDVIHSLAFEGQLKMV